jgi:ribosome recycling factor
MSDDVKDLVHSTEKDMQKSLDSMEGDFQKLRTGRASVGLVEHLMVDYYGSHSHLKSIARITIPEAQVIMISPFDNTSIKSIEKAIQDSELRLTPHSDGKVIRLNIPPLNQERRRDLVKMVKHRVEEAKVAIRNQRRDAMEMLKDLEDEDMISEDDHKRGKEDIEKVTHKYIAKTEELGLRKETEIMEK